MIICYTVPEIWRVMDVIFIFHFGLFFALLPQQLEKSDFKKILKRPILHMCTKNYDHMYSF